jgi:hypothetical protein
MLTAVFAALVLLAVLFFPKGSAEELAADGTGVSPASTPEPVTLDDGVPARQM